MSIAVKYGKKSYVVKGNQMVTREHLEHIYSTKPIDAKYGKKSYVVKGKDIVRREHWNQMDFREDYKNLNFP
jgi:hypothetical protein